LITVKDIARQLGVAASTVTRALADNPRISPAMRARVHAVASELGYVAHAPARVMRGGASTLIGLVIPDVLNDFYSTVAKAMSEHCGEAGFQLVLSLTDDDPEIELRQVRGLISARAAGLVIVPSSAPRQETLSLLRQLPHVQLIRRVSKLAGDWYGIDDVAATRIATRHLLDLGHRVIGYVGGPQDLSTGALRLEGFRRAYRDAGLDPALGVVETGGYDRGFGAAAVDRLLARKPRPTAIVTAAARATVGALEALGRARIAVPEEMSVVGFNDAPTLSWWGPGLTTIGLPVREIAIACGALLLHRVRRPAKPDEPPHRPQSAMHAPFLIERGSTAAPATRATTARRTPRPPRTAPVPPRTRSAPSRRKARA
jgi:LacI family transcriptional regulator